MRHASGWISAAARATTPAKLAAALPDSQAYGLDISRDAVRQACKRSRNVTWLVASMARIPLADASCALLTSVFSPLDWQEAYRLLPVGGGLLRMGPTRQHLFELRQRLYDEVRPYDDEKHLQLIPHGMQLSRYPDPGIPPRAAAGGRPR